MSFVSFASFGKGCKNEGPLSKQMWHANFAQMRLSLIDCTAHCELFRSNILHSYEDVIHVAATFRPLLGTMYSL